MEERQYFSLEDFNNDLWEELDKLNNQPFTNKDHTRNYYWEEEKLDLMPLPSVHYEYTERKEAKVSSDFHVRFDNAYYSVDKAYLHKKVLIRATTSKVKIYSAFGDFICEHSRATFKGQHVTNEAHLPKNYQTMRAWNGPYFIEKAVAVGPNTVAVIKSVLASKKLEVRTYRTCIGILQYKDRYNGTVLEECCSRAMRANKPYYSYIKNTISQVAEELKVSPNSKAKEKKAAPQKGGITRSPKASEIGTLLSKSKDLLGKEADE